MTKNTPTTTPAGDPAKRTVDTIDMTKPFSVILYQTASRNNFQAFIGKNHVGDAEKAASELALNGNHVTAIFGPQVKVKTPPKEPVADDLELAFGQDKT